MKRSLYQTLELYAKKKKTEEKALEALDAAETLEEFCANNMEAAERKAWDAAAAAATAAAQNEKADHNEKPIKIGNGKEKEFVGHTSDWVDRLFQAHHHKMQAGCVTEDQVGCVTEYDWLEYQVD